jgi:hypothetical protein
MEEERNQPVSPENEEEPQIFSVARDVNGNQFNRREFIEKAVVTSAAVTVVAAGCNPKPTVSADMVQEAIKQTQQAQGAAGSSNEPAAQAVEPTSPPAPTNTATKVPTKTPVPPTATITPTPTPEGVESSVTGDNINFRSGPGTGYPAITRLNRSMKILLTGRLADSSWVAVSLADPKKPGSFVLGWVKTTLVTATAKEVESLPIVYDIPPTPTPLPGRAGTTGAGQKGIDYKYTDTYGNVYTYTLPCGSAIPAGATCTCNCVTVPAGCSCVGDTEPSCSCVGDTCTCNSVHYWYPN